MKWRNRQKPTGNLRCQEAVIAEAVSAPEVATGARRGAGTILKSAHFSPRALRRARRGINMAKHPKMKKPSDLDLRSNPMIGGSKGATMAGASSEDLEDLQ